MTKQTYKELKRDRDNILGYAWVFLIVTIIFIILSLILLNNNKDFQKENTKLKEQVSGIQEGSWNLTYYCNWSSIKKNFTAYYEFGRYEDYVEQKRFVEDTLYSCEVLK